MIDIEKFRQMSVEFKDNNGPLRLMENYFDIMIQLIGKLIDVDLDMKNSYVVQRLKRVKELEQELNKWAQELRNYMNQNSKAAEKLYNVSVAGFVENCYPRLHHVEKDVANKDTKQLKSRLKLLKMVSRNYYNKNLKYCKGALQTIQDL